MPNRSAITFVRDPAMEAVHDHLMNIDPNGIRMSKVFRATFDQLYDGQRTGRFKWDQLYKTEKTHYGTLIEINLQREFHFQDGATLDYTIAGEEVDSKYSATGQWMLPPESYGHLVLGSIANDEKSTWSVGMIRASPENLRSGVNRDLKSGLNQLGRSNIRWLHRDAALPPNTLLQLRQKDVESIMSLKSGQARVNQLFRLATNRRIPRNVVATVAQQADFMKRVRANGGARSTLRPEGYLILGGDYSIHTRIARDLGCQIPQPGELVSIRVGPVDFATADSVELDGRFWEKRESYSHVPAPTIPCR